MAYKDKNDWEESDLEDYLEDHDDETDDKWIDCQSGQDIWNEIIDINEPLKSLREALDLKLLIGLSDCKFFLSDGKELNPDSTLADICNKDEGSFEIEIKETFQEYGKTIYTINILNITDSHDNLNNDYEPNVYDNLCANKEANERIVFAKME